MTLRQAFDVVASIHSRLADEIILSNLVTSDRQPPVANTSTGDTYATSNHNNVTALPHHSTVSRAWHVSVGVPVVAFRKLTLKSNQTNDYTASIRRNAFLFDDSKGYLTYRCRSHPTSFA